MFRQVQVSLAHSFAGFCKCILQFFSRAAFQFTKFRAIGAFDQPNPNDGKLVGSSGVAAIGSTGVSVAPQGTGSTGGAVALESACAAILLPTKIFHYREPKCLCGGNGDAGSVKLIAFDAGPCSISASHTGTNRKL